MCKTFIVIASKKSEYMIKRMDSLSSTSTTVGLRGGADRTKTALVIVSSVLFAVGVVLLVVIITRKSPPGPSTTPAAAPVARSRMALELRTEQEARDALNGADPTMVFIYADWCGFCKKADPVFSEIAKDPAYRHVNMLKLNSTKASGLTKERGVSGFPTFLTNWGEGKYVGFKDAAQMKTILQSSKGGVRVSPKVRANSVKRGAQMAAESEALALLQGKEPAVVFLSSDNCGYCKKMLPVWDEVSRDTRFKHVKMHRVDAKTAPNLIKSGGVTGFPTFLSNRGAKKYVGFRPKDKFEEMMVSLGEM
jgi:thiol-disulfide isomerase/thioredoxin